MKTMSNMLLVDWGMGSIIIGVFAVVCIVMITIVFKMMHSDKTNS